MLNVSDLSAYMYCPRKLFLSAVIKLPLPPKDILIKGTIKHSVFDKLNKIEQDIIEEIKTPVEKEKLNGIYEQKFKQIFLDTLEKYSKPIKAFNIDEKEFFEKTWPIYRTEASQRAASLSNFISATKLLGKELWNSLEPKYITELIIKSDKLKLKGKIDKIEVYKNKIIPVELKTGKPPQSGIWLPNKMQLIAYCFLSMEYFNQPIAEGYVHYIDYNEKRKVVLNPFSEIELFNIRDKIFNMLECKIPPKILDNNKCRFCNIKEQCYNYNLK